MKDEQKSKKLLIVELSPFRSIFDQSADAIYVLDMEDGAVVDCNKTACDMLGYTREEILKLKSRDIEIKFPINTKELRDQQIKNIRKAGNQSIDQGIHRKKDGSTFPVEVNSAIRGYNSQEYVLAVVRDVTQRKKHEEAILENQLRLELLHKISAGITAGMSVKGVISHTIKSISTHFPDYRTCYCTINENGFMKIIESFNPEFMPDIKGFEGNISFMRDYVKALRNGETIITENIDENNLFAPLTSSDLNKTKAKALINIPLHHSDKEIGVLCIDSSEEHAWTKGEVGTMKSVADYLALAIKDANTEERKIAAEKEKRALEQQLVQAQRMESIGRLAGGIAHDFNNILTSVQGYAELLKILHHDTDTEEAKAAEFILNGTKRAGELTKQLLGFARGGKYNPVAININNAIKDVIKISEKIFEKKIDVIYDFEKNVDPVEADKSQLDQALTSIIINAKDAMPNGGMLIFKTQNVHIDQKSLKKYSGLKVGDYTKISIKDTGIGIDEENVNVIFEPFYSTKSTGKGTGLGLAMVYGMVKNHQGLITCDSEVGKGTEFTIYLPSSKGKVVEDNLNANILADGNETILVVDDENDVRMLIETQLKRMGYKVYSAVDGLEAISLYQEHKDEIDLVLLDMIMPNLAGRETYYELKQINDDVKILIMSGFSQDTKATEILQHGAKGFLQKPFTLQQLSANLRKVLK